MLQDQLHKLFIYDQKSGKLFNKKKKQGLKVGEEAGWLVKSGRNSIEQYYKYVKINGKAYKAHRLIWIYNYGEISKNMQIDHINHNGLDNRLSNLRLVTRKENQKNKRKARNNSSGVTGVYYREDCDMWRAIITSNNKRFDLGTFSKKEDAIRARQEAEKEYGFHLNHGR